MERRRIVITGMGMVSPVGCTVPSAWETLLSGKSGIVPIRSFDASQCRSRIAGHLADDYSAEDYLDFKERKNLDISTQFGLVTVKKAVADSGIDFSKENPLRCGSIIGSGIGGLGTMETQAERCRTRGPAKISPFTVPRMIANSTAGHASILYHLQGPSFAPVSACASAAHAMACAIDAIRLGKVDVCLTGGAEGCIVEVAVASFSAMRALSERNDDPQHASRPFDADRDGFVIGEGAGILIFEELEHAKKRGAKIYAEVMGYGASSDAFNIVQPCEDGEGAGYAMQFALEDAGINASDVGYINAHGTSTHLGDIAETSAIKRVFGESAYQVSISSTKSQIGHLLGASGAVGLIFTALAIQNGVIPATMNLDTPDPLCDLDYTPNVPRERKIRYAMANSFGFGGHNASLVIGAFNG